MLDLITEVQLARLQELGFSMDDCRKALLICQGNFRSVLYVVLVLIMVSCLATVEQSD